MKSDYQGEQSHAVTNWLRGTQLDLAFTKGRSVKGTWNICACFRRVYAAKALDRRSKKDASVWPWRGSIPARTYRLPAESTPSALGGSLYGLLGRSIPRWWIGVRRVGDGARRASAAPGIHPLPPCTNRGVER